MNLKLTNFSTIIIVNKNQEQTKSIRVKTKHLKRVKHYIAGIVCVIVVLAGTIIYLTSKGDKQEQEKKETDMDVFSYLNRPLSFERFLTTITKIQDYLSATIYIHHARNNRFVFIKSEYKIIKVKFEDILFCEGMKDYTQVHLKGKAEPILTLNNLKSFSYKLPPEEFIRVHRSFVVSLSHIDSIARNEIYIGKKIIPIGDSFKDDFYQIVEWNS